VTRSVVSVAPAGPLEERRVLTMAAKRAANETRLGSTAVPRVVISKGKHKLVRVRTPGKGAASSAAKPSPPASTTPKRVVLKARVTNGGLTLRRVANKRALSWVSEHAPQPQKRRKTQATPATAAHQKKSLRGGGGGGGAAPAPAAKRKRGTLALRRQGPCPRWVRYGRCRDFDKGECPCEHNPEHVALCRRWMSSGACSNPACRLQHECIPERMPVCSYFLQGRCASADCQYLHVKVDPEAAVCHAFLTGFCPKGPYACPNRHTVVCQALEKTGTCPNREKCRMHHPRFLLASTSIPEAQAPREPNLLARSTSIVPAFIRSATANDAEEEEAEEREPAQKRLRTE